MFHTSQCSDRIVAIDLTARNGLAINPGITRTIHPKAERRKARPPVAGPS
jgi:hypothetical protein